METRLYHHKTDGGAEYLCTRPVEGTDEGDLHYAVVRLDGPPEMAGAIVDLREACSTALVDYKLAGYGHCKAALALRDALERF